MVAMAGGDPASVFTFLERCRRSLVGTVRSILDDLGRPDLVADPALVDALVIDAAFVLFDVAPGWRPGTASPWRWAHRAIRAAVVAEIGHPSIGLDAEVEPDRLVGPAPDEATFDVDLDAMARRHPAIAAYLDEIGRVAGRHRDLVIEYQIQQACGDPSPAHTVAELFNTSAANVRQIVSRTRRALKHGAGRVAVDESIDRSAALLPRRPEMGAAIESSAPVAPTAPAPAPPAITRVVDRSGWRSRARALLGLALGHRQHGS